MQSPYLKPNRLAEVIAAITALATYRFYKLDFEELADRVSGSKSAADHWKAVLKEHPEFFRYTTSEEQVSLIWRRQFPRTYNVDSGIDEEKPQGQKFLEGDRISRRPLSSAETEILISTAVSLHSRAVEQSNLAKWWLPVLIAAMALAGALLGNFFAG